MKETILPFTMFFKVQKISEGHSLYDLSVSSSISKSTMLTKNFRKYFKCGRSRWMIRGGACLRFLDERHLNHENRIIEYH